MCGFAVWVFWPDADRFVDPRRLGESRDSDIQAELWWLMPGFLFFNLCNKL